MVGPLRSLVSAARRVHQASWQRRHPDPNPFPVDAWTDPAYEAWFETHRAAEPELERQRRVQADFANRPVFSFIVPLYRTPHEYLMTMAESVLRQTYPELELVLVNASPELPELVRSVRELASRDGRVRVVTLGGNLGITENTNRGIAAATGDFCCFLDHDDFIEPDLLFEYVTALETAPDIDVLYCDEDHVARDERTGSFRHVHPFFKPAFSPELMLCKNAVIHLMTVRRSLIDAMPTPDARYDGAQDYNMVLRCAEMARQVHGVQRVLYHWRISEESTATNPDAKPYSQRATRLVASEALARCAPNARIISSGILNLHTLWFPSAGTHSVSVIVDRGGWTEREGEATLHPGALARFVEFFTQNNSCASVEVLLAGAGKEVLSQIKSDTVFRSVECGDGARRFERLNVVAGQARGDYLVFLDAGCSFDTPEPLEQLTGACSLPGVGVVAPKSLYRDGRVRAYGVAVTSERIMPLYRGYEDYFPGYQCNLRAFQDVSASTLEGLTISRELFEHIGGFDESFESEIGAVDLCHRVREEGLRIVQTCTVKVRCDEAAPKHFFVDEDNVSDFPPTDISRYDERWPESRASGDPYFNDSLDQSSEHCTITAARRASRAERAQG